MNSDSESRSRLSRTSGGKTAAIAAATSPTRRPQIRLAIRKRSRTASSPEGHVGESARVDTVAAHGVDRAEEVRVARWPQGRGASVDHVPGLGVSVARRNRAGVAVVVERVLLGPVSRISDDDGGAHHQGEQDQQRGRQPRTGSEGTREPLQTRRAALVGGPRRVSLRCFAQLVAGADGPRGERPVAWRLALNGPAHRPPTRLRRSTR